MSGMCIEFNANDHLLRDFKTKNSIGGINFVFELILL